MQSLPMTKLPKCGQDLAMLRGIRRTFGSAQREAKPLLREDMIAIIERMGDRPKDIRDKALLLIGFAGAFRRSELVSDVTNIEHVCQGLVIDLRFSKTDQDAKGRKIGIPFGRTRWCPVTHVADWLNLSEIKDGPVFRSLDKAGRPSICRLSGEAVSQIVKRHAAGTGLSPDDFSGHSLRAGPAAGAAKAGVSAWKIRQQTGHASEAMPNR